MKKKIILSVFFLLAVLSCKKIPLYVLDIPSVTHFDISLVNHTSDKLLLRSIAEDGHTIKDIKSDRDTLDIVTFTAKNTGRDNVYEGTGRIYPIIKKYYPEYRNAKLLVYRLNQEGDKELLKTMEYKSLPISRVKEHPLNLFNPGWHETARKDKWCIIDWYGVE